MTIAITDNKVQYTADGVQLDFPFQFRVLEEDHLVVTQTDGAGITTVVDEGAYTISGINEESGNVRFLSPPASGLAITLYRSVPATQLTDYVEYDPFPAESHETALDKLTMICQQLQEQLDRSFLLPHESGDGSILLVELSEPYANTILTFDDTGTVLRNEFEIGNYIGYWSNGSNYKARVTFSDPLTENLYVVLKDHIASDLAADEAAGNIHKAMDFATTVQKRDEAVQAANAAAVSEANAATSEANAATSESNAATSELNAFNWAQADIDVPVDDGTNQGFSAFHWSQRAEDFINQGGALSVSREIVNSTGVFIDDLNATDFTGDQYADDTITTSLEVTVNMSVNFSYDGVFYVYQGLKPTTIGLGSPAKLASEFSILTTASAAAVSFDASAYPGSTVDNVQDAIDALATRDAESIVYDNTQGFPTPDNVQGAIDEVGQLIRYMGQWSYGAVNANFTLAETIGNPPLYNVTGGADITVTLPADGGVAVGEVFSFFTTSGATVTFDTSTNAQTIIVPEGKAATFRGNGSIFTITYISGNFWLCYGDLVDA